VSESVPPGEGAPAGSQSGDAFETPRSAWDLLRAIATGLRQSPILLLVFGVAVVFLLYVEAVFTSGRLEPWEQFVVALLIILGVLILAWRVTAGPSPPSAERPIVVDSAGHGDYLTIGEAIDAAKPGDSIHVRAGEYHEGLVLTKPLEIIGDGANQVQVEATGTNAVLVHLGEGGTNSSPITRRRVRIAGLTLRTNADERFGVDVKRGHLVIEDCDISSQSLACVAVCGKEAKATLRRNTIHDGAEGGVYIRDGANALVEHNRISGHKKPAVEVLEHANATVRDNVIEDNKDNGVRVFDNGRADLRDNTLLKNEYQQVSFGNGGSGALQHNVIREGKHAGVYIGQNGRGLYLEDNDIYDNAFSGVDLSAGSTPRLRKNRINRNGHHAIYLENGSGGDLKYNDLSGNTLGPWSKDPKTEPLLDADHNT
jgi:F-box protein 11